MRGIPQEPPAPDKVDKAEMAFKLYDKDKDGYVTKGEMNKLARNLTKDQIDKVKVSMNLTKIKCSLPGFLEI